MKIGVRSCRIEELAGVVECLDGEFVHAKGRGLSLRTRFPHTFSDANLEGIRVAMDGDRLLGANAVRFFDWKDGRRLWRGAMVGMVWVAPEARGQGIGTQLMNAAVRWIQEKDADFGILWTATPAFYERAGWIAKDQGLFGEARLNLPALRPKERCATVSCHPAASMDPIWMEAIRSRFQRARVVRSRLDYRATPIPAERVVCFMAQDETDSVDGFALVGEGERTGYLYEVSAPPALREALWAEICGRYDRLYVNGKTGDDFSRLLAETGRVVWHPQNKAMWLPVLKEITMDGLNWHIPYFDWI